MDHFRIWLRPVGQACKVCAEGREQAEWLRTQLQREGVICDEAVPTPGTLRWNFRATYTPRMLHAQLRRFLDRLPEVEVMLDPA